MRNELDKQIVNRVLGQAYEVLDTIIAPMCGIDGVIADLYLADIATYTINDENLEEEIIEKIITTYKLSKYTLINAYTPLALIGLMIVDSPQYKEL